MPKFTKEYTELLNKASKRFCGLTQTQRNKVIVDDYLNHYL